MSGLSSRKREHSNFQSRSARDEAGELSRRYSMEGGSARPTESREQSNPYEPATNDSTPPPREFVFTKRLLREDQYDGEPPHLRKRSASGKRRQTMGDISLTEQVHNEIENKKGNGGSAPKQGLGPRPVGGVEKLGMFSGVYVPTCLNVLSILMFLRFGFILGQWSTIFPANKANTRRVKVKEEY